MAIRWTCRTFILAMLLVIGAAFKHEEFKTCEKANFCKRNRRIASAHHDYRIDSKEVRVVGDRLEAAVWDQTEPNVTLSIAILAYEGGIVRLQVREPQDRYEVEQVLVEDLEEKRSKWTEVQIKADHVSLKNGQVTVKMKYSPLKVQLIQGGKPFITFNERQLFHLEHTHTKGENETEGTWEEKFRSFTDSKPHGPQAISADVTFHSMQHVYGLPERASSFSLKDTFDEENPISEPYRLYNLDVFEYEHDSPFGLYGSIPLLLAHKAGLTVGALWLNGAEMFVDVSSERSSFLTGKHVVSRQSHWIAESGIVDFFFMPGPSPADVTKQYAQLTGTASMPPMFGISYHQCRWNYNDQEDVMQVDASFDEHNIPYDVIWLDIEHTNGKRYLTWDRHKFPEPKKMQDDIASKGRKMVTIVDPHIKRDKSYAIFKEAEKAGYFVKTKDKKDFDGWCWPGSSSYLDVLNPEIREWWAKQLSEDKYPQSTQNLHIWNDMNEPSVFNGPEVTMPKDNLHFPNGTSGLPVEHRDVHNLYGLFYHAATAEGLKLRSGGKERPFVLSRAFYSGSQKYGAIWTGDNAADWNHLKVSVPMLLSLNIAGISFSGADVGGFFGNPEADLLTRWYQLGTYYPFLRAHAHLETKRREPWLFGEPATSRIRDALKERYALLPYLYTLFRWGNLTGQPIMRPLWYEFPNDSSLFDRDDAFMLGNSLLVYPVVEKDASSVSAWLPGSEPWYSAKTGLAHPPGTATVNVDMETIPVWTRGGTIMARKERPRRSSAQAAFDPLTLVISLDRKEMASGDLYVDDGHSFEFDAGNFIHRKFSFEGHTLTNARFDGLSTWQMPVEIERIVILGLKNKKWSAFLQDGTPLDVEKGPLIMAAGNPHTALVVRKPKLPVSSDWSITFHSA